MAWEACCSRLIPDPNVVARFAESSFAYALARIETHYFVNQGFFAHDGQLFTDAHRLQDIPTVIIQGRYDMVCPIESAWRLHRELRRPARKVALASSTYAVCGPTSSKPPSGSSCPQKPPS